MKMKVLWIAFQPLPIIGEDLMIKDKIVAGGWLQGASDIICNHNDIELIYCFRFEHYVEGKIGKISYYSLREVPEVKKKNIAQYDAEDMTRLRYILDKCRPDIIQIFGTEKWFMRQFVYMLSDLNMLDKTLVWIQGLTYFYSNCYTDGLTVSQIKRKTFWERIRSTNIEGIQKILRTNGEGEIQILKFLKNVSVRTEWDAACCKAINANLKLYMCNETLRPAFYEGDSWNIKNVKRYSIFMSQSNTPIKGYHMMLKALPIILQEFPECVLYTTGNNLLQEETNVIGKVREPSYKKILREEIIKNNLQEHVRFTGILDEKGIKSQYLSAHVFVSASSIENSPNSVGEAMILGVPIVASDVGGVGSMIVHNEEGLLYPFNEYAMLAEYVCKIFRSDELALRLSQKAMKRGEKNHDQEENYRTLLDNYTKIINGEYKYD